MGAAGKPPCPHHSQREGDLTLTSWQLARRSEQVACGGGRLLKPLEVVEIASFLKSRSCHVLLAARAYQARSTRADLAGCPLGEEANQVSGQ